MDRSTKYLLIGGGVASVNASMAIRELDKEGSMMIVTDEKHMPYDRPPLSKAYIVKDLVPDDISSKFDNYYTDNNIDVVRGVKADKLDRKHKTVTLSDGSSVSYEKLLIATGARAKKPKIPGAEQIMLLRSIDDSERIRNAAANAKSVVVLGGGFIGVEVASQLLKKGLDTTLFVTEKYPWGKFASPAVGEFLADYLRKAGINVYVNDDAGSIEHGTVVAHSKMRLDTDLIVAGLGVELNTELAFAAGLHGDDEGIHTNEMLQTADPDVFAAGDVAQFEDYAMGKTWHVEHHLHARWQGQTAGANMAGANQVYDRVPYFYSDFLDLHMILRGDPQVGSHNTRPFGDFDSAGFVELHADDAGVVRMGIAINRQEPKVDVAADKIEALIRAKAKLQDVVAADLE